MSHLLNQTTHDSNSNLFKWHRDDKMSSKCYGIFFFFYNSQSILLSVFCFSKNLSSVPSKRSDAILRADFLKHSTYSIIASMNACQQMWSVLFPDSSNTYIPCNGQPSPVCPQLFNFWSFGKPK